MLKSGDTVEWIGDDVFVGPRRRECAVRKGDKRIVCGVSKDQTKICINVGYGNMGQPIGLFGSVDVANVRKIES